MAVEQLFFLFISFLLGTCIGSFLNVLVDRIPRGESFLLSSSHCDHCQKRLAWYDMVPLFSFALLKGYCRYCKARLGYYYPLLELITGTFFLVCSMFFMFVVHQSVPSVLFMFALLVGSGLIVIFFTDIKYGIIPDQVILFLAIITVLYTLLYSTFLPYFLAGVGAFCFFYMLFYFTKGRGMGFGDVKLAFLIGMILGPLLTLIALYMAFLTGAIVSLILVITKKKKLRGDTIPFGPFMVIGTVISILGADLFSGLLRTFF